MEFTNIAGLIISFICLVITFSKNIKRSGENDGMIMSELGYIKATSDDIKKKVEQSEQRHIEMTQKIALLEASVSSAHKRIDEMKGGH